MYRIKIVRPDDNQVLYLGHYVNRKPVYWHDPKYAKPFLTRQDAEAEKQRIKETKGRKVQIHIEPIKT